jgi:hypothetical protein
VRPLPDELVLQRRLVGRRRGRVVRVGEGRVAVAQGAVGDALDVVTLQAPGRQEPAHVHDKRLFRHG